MTMNDKWLTLDAIRPTRFDFNDGIDFTIHEWKKAVIKLGSVVSNISQWKHTGIHLHEKAIMPSKKP
jgi:hypothetical protein